MTDDDDRDIPPSKLTRSKESWARQGRFLTGRADGPHTRRLPPGQHLVTNWPVLDLGQHPGIPREQWRLQIYGAVEQPLLLDWDAMMALPQSASVSDIHCVTTWSRYDNNWEGVRTRDLLAATRPHPDVRYVVLHSHDNYTTNLALEDFAAEESLLAHSWSGQPLAREHGGPARMVVPHLYFWKSAKWIRDIEFRTADSPGFWEVRGYHNRADPWLEERYSE
jgi:DMSO/TMAO reductase YedYZ molybdopterin-dependent catalytic subunit